MVLHNKTPPTIKCSLCVDKFYRTTAQLRKHVIVVHQKSYEYGLISDLLYPNLLIHKIFIVSFVSFAEKFFEERIFMKIIITKFI